MSGTESRKLDRDSMNAALVGILDIGELLLESGAEVNRVEDTIRRLCRAYGFVRTDVFTITSSIIVTAILEDGYAMTQTRRIYGSATDLGRIERLNAFSRRICAEPVSPAEMQRELTSITFSRKRNVTLEFVTYAGVSAVFSVFFGGNGIDAAAAAISGLFLFLTVEFSRRLRLNSIFQNMVCSALTGVVVMLLVRAGLGQHPDKIMIGNIMLVIPGIQLTTSLRDMMNGDIITGSLNLCEAVMKAIAVAAGFAFVVTRMGGAG